MADLYRVIPNPTIEGSSKLCATKPVAHLIVWKSEKQGNEADARTIVAFSGLQFDPASSDECGRFVYNASHR